MPKFKIEKTNTVNEYFDATNTIGGTGGFFQLLTPTVVFLVHERVVAL